MDCPDGGTCHHRCVERCWRVRNAGPITGTFPGDQWPEDVRREHSLDALSTGDLWDMLGLDLNLPLRVVLPDGTAALDVIGATWEDGHVHLRLLPTVSACPECAAGKCGNCDDTAWDTGKDEPARCPCSLVAHPRRTS